MRITFVDVQNVNYHKHDTNKLIKVFVEMLSPSWMTWIPTAFLQESDVFAIIVCDIEELFNGNGDR
jgi:hypothetical protein